MPANLPPEYFAVEKKYRIAKTVEEKIQILKELLSVVPKHKGTEKLQKEIKSKIARLRRELEESKKSGKKTFYIHIKKQGAAQVTFIGPPNVGKSSIISKLTNAPVVIAPYPFSTTFPVAGMMDYEDIQIQLVDTSPITEEHIDYWVLDLIRGCDLVVVVLSVEDGKFLEDFESVKEKLKEHGISLIGKGLSEDSLFGAVRKRALIVINKIDLFFSEEDLQVFEELSSEFPIIRVSSERVINMDSLKKTIFRELDIVRIYTKPPGKDPVLYNPIILKRGQTVLDAAEEVHKDFREKLKYARVWGSSVKFPGQRVERNHILEDKDIVEFHI